MGEQIPVTPEQEAVDLGAGQLSDHDKLIRGKQLEVYEQQIKQRTCFFVAALFFSGLMTAAFLYFGHRILYMIETNSGMAPDWHFLLLGSELIIPPTIVMFGLLRRLYDLERQSKKEKPEPLPAGNVLGEVSGMVKSVSEMIGAVTDKLIKAKD